MKPEESRTLCLMCWLVGLFFLLVAVFAATYQHVNTSFTLFDVYVELPIEEWYVTQPYQRFEAVLSFLGLAFLAAGVELFRHSHKMLEKKE